jgi:DNA-binding transcriptional LysR family regulator
MSLSEVKRATALPRCARPKSAFWPGRRTVLNFTAGAINAVQELERQIGAVLVERKRQGVHLTDEGEEIARRTARILSNVRDLVEYAQQRHRLLSGRLRLGVIPTIAPYLLPPHCRSFAQITRT